MYRMVAAVMTVGLLVSGLAPATPPAFAAQTLEGTVRTLAADTVEHVDEHPVGGRHFTGTSKDVYQQILEVGDKSYVLKGKKAPNNARVRVSGMVTGQDVQADTVTVLKANSSPLPPPVGTTRVLVMLAYWTAPDGVTQATASTQMFGDSNEWYRDASYNALGQTGDVTPWMQIAGPVNNRCYSDRLNMMSQAKTAATGLGYALSNYDNFVLYFPNANALPGADCQGFAGWAYIGAPGTWLNGFLDRRVTVHEQGHNYGLWHSHSLLCSNVITGGCSFSEYGDAFDAMGNSSFVGHFNASQKTLLGWMQARTVDLTAGGSTTLVPMASDSAAPHAAVITASSTKRYWLEYRQPIDFDSLLPPAGADGVQVRVAGTGSGADDTGASLLDMRPADGLSVFSATMRTGEAWTSPEGITISVGAVSAAGAQVQVVGPGARYNALTPTRILDTRFGLGAPPARIGAGFTFDVQVTGQGGVPATGVSAVVLNVTAVLPTASSFLTAWPAGQPRPAASNLNYVAGDIVPNVVVVKVGAGGKISMYNQAGLVDVAGDVAGYYGDTAAPIDGAPYNPLTPARILDTRFGLGAPPGKLGPVSTIDVQLTGRGGVPAIGVSAVVLNVTAVAPSAESFLTAWPSGEVRPAASNLNYVAGDIVPNLVVVKVGAGGKVSMYNQAGLVNVAADVAGYYGEAAAATGARYNALTPARILDTRFGLGAPTVRMGPASSIDLQVTGRGGVPTGASAVVLNVTAVFPSAESFVTAWPAGQVRPAASNLNFVVGDVVPNLVVVKIGAGGRVSLYNQAGSVDLAADVAGWFNSE